MSRLRVAPIVEGHGEVQSVRILLARVWTELLGGDYIDVLRPIRVGRYKLIKAEELNRAVELAVMTLADATSPRDAELVLVLVDADNDPPCVLGPCLLEEARRGCGNVDISCVVANLEYETWFVAAAESLSKYLELPPGDEIPSNPEVQRCRKSWIRDRFGGRATGRRYSERSDQPAMTATMDLVLCRERSPSFDKLCRELERFLDP